MHHLLLEASLLVLLRHAESERNAGKKGTYYTDEEKAALGNKANHNIVLTAKGHTQAKEAGAEFYKKYGTFDIVINSGYLRTRETMEGVLYAYTKEERERTLILEDIALRERDSGYTYHMTENEADGHFPWNKESWSINGPFFSRPAGGESLADVTARLDTFFTRLAMICKEKKVLLVGHGRLFVAAQSLLENWKHEDYQKLPTELENACHLEYAYSKEKRMLIRA